MNSTTQTATAELRFSLVVAVHNVAPYLPEFIASVENQSYDLSRVEIVMVDDGSTDASPEILRDWQRTRPDLVTVLTKPNGGQGSARNLGLTVARGEWINFADPDDRLDPSFLSQVDAFVTTHPETELVATNRLILNDRTGEVRDRHPLRIHFVDGDRVVDLNLRPEAFFGSAPAGFFKREVIEATGLTFDERIRPNFEDGHFTVKYLFGCPAPKVAFLRSAVYEYRRRSDRTSSTQQSSSHPGRYTDVVEFGYLDVLRQAHESLGRVPLWLQTYVLYELAFYMSSASRGSRTAMAATGPVAERFHELMPQVLEYLEPAVINSFQLKRSESVWRDIYTHAWQSEPWHSPYAVVSDRDEVQNLIRVVYRFTGQSPREQFLHGDQPVEPSHAKYRVVEMFDRVMLHERIVWIDSSNSVALRLDEQLIELRSDWPEPSNTFTVRNPEDTPTLAVGNEDKQFVGAKDRFLHSKSAGVLRKIRDTGIRQEAKSGRILHKYANAWVLLDRVQDADDSGEHLFRYLRQNRPDINAWFVLEADTPDSKRLISEGYGKRLVEYGSHAWKLLMSNCAVVISSHAGPPMFRPEPLQDLLDPDWKFVFLQHGVIKDDVSKVFNRMPIDIFVTSTPKEQQSIVGDDTGYVFTTKEAKLTELPRFDLVLERGREFPPQKRDLVLMAPTWRAWLAKPEKGSFNYSVSKDFLQTDFAENWLGLLRSERIAEAAAETGLTLAFLPHPVLQSILTDLDLPEYVKPLGFEGEDVRGYFARSAVFVTDFSSMAFNAAYIERPVVYFQFDRPQYFGGAHFGKEGYFDYDEQGFGPVTLDLPAAEDTIVSTIEAGPIPSAKYIERIHQTFPYRDGRARERVTDEVERLLGKGGPLSKRTVGVGEPGLQPSRYSALPEPE